MEGGEDVVTQLARLGVLRKDGVLSEDEFVTAKQRLLTTSPATVVAEVAAPAPEPDVASPHNTSGWLWKKGGIRKKWERRWFVYRASQCRFEQSLHYYADDGCKTPKGSIDVWKSSTPARVSTAPGCEPFDIELEHPQRTWQLRAAGADEQAMWIDLISQMIAHTHQINMRNRRMKRGIER